MELNPNHATTERARHQWHKFVAILMQKLKQDAVEITIEDVMALGDNEKAVVIDERDGKMVLRLLSMAEAEKLAREEGGLPV